MPPDIMQNIQTPIALQPGYRLQNWYRIDRVLGQGSCGATYLAHDCNLERAVAVKEYLPAELAVRESGVFVQPGTSHGEDAYHIGLEAFIDEARRLAKLEHSNTPSIINVFVSQNTAYMVMSYEEGESLETLVRRRGTLEEAELLQLLMPLLGALEDIHDHALVHGALTPAHILVRGDGDPVLVDFAGTRRVVAEQTHSAVDVLPGYSAPEQYFGKSLQIGPSTDIYGLAATLYRAVAGVVPPDALERRQTLVRESRDPLIPCLKLAGPHYSESLLNAIDCGLNLDPALRPQSIAAWRREFGACPDARPGVAPPYPVPASAADQPAHPQERRHSGQHPRARVLTGGALALALLGIGAWLPSHESTARSELPHDARSRTLMPAQGAAGLSVASRSTTAGGGTSATIPPSISPERSAIDPNERNTQDKYQSAAALRRGQIEAKKGLQQIADKLIHLSRAAMDRGDWTMAQQYLAQAGSILPDLQSLDLARQELQALKPELTRQRRTSEEAAKLLPKPAQNPRDPAPLAAAARRAIDRHHWDKAESYLDRLAQAAPESGELPALRKALDEARQLPENQPKPGTRDAAASPRKVHTFIDRARRAMDHHQWEKAQSYVDKATALVPDSEEVTLLQGEMNLRKAGEEARKSSEAPAATGEKARSAATQQADKVEIRDASASQLPVHP